MKANPSEVAFERGLPANPEAERLILGSVLLDSSLMQDMLAQVQATDFSIHKNALIFNAMTEMHSAGIAVDRISLIEELCRRGQVEAVDGISYVTSLDDGLPRIVHLENYARIVREKSQLRRFFYMAEKIRDQVLLGEDTAADIRGGAEDALAGVSVAKTVALSAEEIINAIGLNAFLSPGSRSAGLKTGFIRLDAMTCGLNEGDLFILAARPSMGKTALALNILSHVALRNPDAGTPVLYSLEMSRESILQRMVCSTGRVDMQKFRMGYLNGNENERLRQATGEIVGSKLKIDDSGQVGIYEMHAGLRAIQRRDGLSIAVVDYLQLMATSGKSENRTQEVSKLSRGLKLMAKDLKIPIIALSQLSRATETRAGDKRPIMSDLRDSGSIEQDADLIGFLFREEYYKPDREDLRGQAELIIAKQRSGPTGHIPLVFLKEYAKFENRLDQMELGDEQE